MANNAPIGIYDSGLGGLTVWREVRRLLPHEALVYLGDGKNCPYGSRPKEEILPRRLLCLPGFPVTGFRRRAAASALTAAVPPGTFTRFPILPPGPHAPGDT